MKNLRLIYLGAIFIITISYTVADCYGNWLHAWDTATANYQSSLADCNADWWMGPTAVLMCRSEAGAIYDGAINVGADAYDCCVQNC